MSHPVNNETKKQLSSKLQLFKKRFIRWLAQRPIFSLFLIISIGVILLPGVTIVVLTPVAVLLSYLGILATPGGILALHGILFKGFLFAVFCTGVLSISFILMTCFGVIQSYKLFPSWVSNKNK